MTACVAGVDAERAERARKAGEWRAARLERERRRAEFAERMDRQQGVARALLAACMLAGAWCAVAVVLSALGW